MEVVVCVHCGDAVFKEMFERGLEAQGFQLCGDGGFDLLVDRPLGWAMREHPDIDFGRCIILSDNLCPPYRLDLLDKQPAALIHLTDGDALLPTLMIVQAGNTVHPKVKTPLTAAERKTLRLTALGYKNAEIAEQRGVTVKTVKNSLTEIYKKTKLRSRVEIAYYYVGHWHLIRNWEKPPFVT